MRYSIRPMSTKRVFYTQLKKDLTNMNESLKKVSDFSDDETYKMKNLLSEINARISINNEKIKAYYEIQKNPKSKPITRVNAAIDVFSENFTIYEQKITLLETHNKGFYNRIETLTKCVNKLKNTVAYILEFEGKE